MTRLDTILRLNGNPDKRWQPYCKAAIAQVVNVLAVIQAFDVGPSRFQSHPWTTFNFLLTCREGQVKHHLGLVFGLISLLDTNFSSESHAKFLTWTSSIWELAHVSFMWYVIWARASSHHLKVNQWHHCKCSTCWFLRWPGQNGTDKMVAIFIDSNSTELNFYSVTTSHK